MEEPAKAPVIVLWDIENVPLPRKVTGMRAYLGILEALRRYGPISSIQAFAEPTSLGAENRNQLNMSGIKVCAVCAQSRNSGLRRISALRRS